MGLAGKYTHEKNENLKEYFLALKVPADLLEKASQTSNALEIKVDGNKVTLNGKLPLTFEVGKEFDDPMPTGEVLKTVASLEGSKLVLKSKRPTGEAGTRTYEATSDGLVVTLAADATPVVAKRFYKRA